jgi:hypothetical protein
MIEGFNLALFDGILGYFHQAIDFLDIDVLDIITSRLNDILLDFW